MREMFVNDIVNAVGKQASDLCQLLIAGKAPFPSISTGASST